MKTPSDQLFKLIQSLNAQEKRFYKIEASYKGKNSHNLILFDAVNGLKNYDENTLRKKLKNKLPLKDLPVIKNYTIEAILDAMEQYYKDDFVEARLARLIQNIGFLISKNLYTLAKRVLIKAEKLALENEHYAYLLIVLEIKGSLREKPKKGSGNYNQELHERQANYIDIYKNLVRYTQLYDELWSIYQYSGATDNNKITLLLKDPLLQHESHALSHWAKVWYNYVLGTAYLLMNDFEKAYEYQKGVNKLYEEKNSLKIDKLGLYFANMINILYTLSLLKKSKDHLAIKNKLELVVNSFPKKLLSNNLMNKYLGIVNSYINFLNLALDFKEALKICDEVKIKVNDSGNHDNYLVFYYNFFVACFCLGAYHKALEKLNKILNFKDADIRKDIIHEVRIINLIVHYELGNEDLLPALCKSTQRLLEKEGTLSQAASLILIFFSKRIIAAKSKSERINIFIKLRGELAPLIPKDLSDNFDFISWIESKIENKPILEILKSKMK